MQGLDLEHERQQADEELTQLLGELVVKPLHSQLAERLQSELFTFGEELDSKLRQQLAPLGKSRDLKNSFEELEQCLEDGQRLLRQQQHDLGAQLADAQQAYSQRADALQARVQTLAEQLEQVSQHLAQDNQQMRRQLSEQLKQQALALRTLLDRFEQADSAHVALLKTSVQALSEQLAQARQILANDSRQLQGELSEQWKQQMLALCEQLTRIEQADSKHVAVLQASVQALAGQVAATQQSLADNHRQLYGQLSEQLQQQVLALREQLEGKQEQSTQSLLAGLQQQKAAQQEQLQRAHAELSAKLQEQTADERQQVLELLQQQQALLVLQQEEVQQLRRSLSAFAWTGLALGGLSCAGLAMLALHTPAIRTLLGLTV